MSSVYNITIGSLYSLTKVWALFTKHYAELTTNKDLMVLDPAWERYSAMEEQGNLLVLMAYKDDEVVGYSVNFVDRHLHYAGLTVCSNDLLFIVPDQRNSPLGLRLMKETKRSAKACGAQLMLWHAKPNTSLNTLMVRKEVKVQDIIYSEPL